MRLGSLVAVAGLVRALPSTDELPAPEHSVDKATDLKLLYETQRLVESRCDKLKEEEYMPCANVVGVCYDTALEDLKEGRLDGAEAAMQKVQSCGRRKISALNACPINKDLSTCVAQYEKSNPDHGNNQGIEAASPAPPTLASGSHEDDGLSSQLPGTPSGQQTVDAAVEPESPVNNNQQSVTVPNQDDATAASNEDAGQVTQQNNGQVQPPHQGTLPSSQHLPPSQQQQTGGAEAALVGTDQAKCVCKPRNSRRSHASL